MLILVILILSVGAGAFVRKCLEPSRARSPRELPVGGSNPEIPENAAGQPCSSNAGNRQDRLTRIGNILGKTATWTVWLLIFIFGVSLGSNEEIVSDFPRFGLTAAVVALAGTAGSVVGAWFFQRLISKRRKQ